LGALHFLAHELGIDQARGGLWTEQKQSFAWTGIQSIRDLRPVLPGTVVLQRHQEQNNQGGGQIVSRGLYVAWRQGKTGTEQRMGGETDRIRV
jgi:hypothetical protein